MIYSYTAVISQDGDTFYARVPDIDGCTTTARSLPEAIDLITDAMNLALVVLEDEGISPRHPTKQADITHSSDDVLTIIQADTIKYRSMTDTKAVRKNVSIPAWMANLADKRGINCSKVLQEALLSLLS
ncbi:MAG: type II toxin-antitoxin system HicB family antitoxin [Muricoprocola sp.]